MSYLALKYLHITCVILSISLFSLRGLLTLRGTNWRRSKALRIAPHIIDTVLLGSAIWMTTLIQQYPFTANWLTAKLIALLAYIAFGKIALGKNTQASRRAPAFAAALLSVAYIVGVALTKSVSWGVLPGCSGAESGSDGRVREATVPLLAERENGRLSSKRPT